VDYLRGDRLGKEGDSGNVHFERLCDMLDLLGLGENDNFRGGHSHQRAAREEKRAALLDPDTPNRIEICILEFLDEVFGSRGGLQGLLDLAFEINERAREIRRTLPAESDVRKNFQDLVKGRKYKGARQVVERAEGGAVGGVTGEPAPEPSVPTPTKAATPENPEAGTEGAEDGAGAAAGGRQSGKKGGRKSGKGKAKGKAKAKAKGKAKAKAKGGRRSSKKG
jgi:hypothetical protein